MAAITFKGKVQTMRNMDDTVAYMFVAVPALDRKHCDMEAFRKHPKYGSYANSDMFPSVLARIVDDTFGKSYSGARKLRLDMVPDGVTVDASGFLAVVTLTV